MPMYAGPIVDSHHHIWLHKDVAWLHPPVTQKLFGDYFGLRRDFTIDEWMNDILPQNVVKSVHVTANWGPTRSVDESRWLQEISSQHGFPHATTVQADLTSPDLAEQLKAQADLPNTRGVRHQLYWDSHPLNQVCDRPDLCNTPAFRRGFEMVAGHGLRFELQIFASQARFAAALVKAFPQTPFMLLHSGMLIDPFDANIVNQWRDGLAELASYPNVHVKISGLNMYTHGATTRHMRQVIRDSIQIFGVERTVFGSNFPLEKLWFGYGELMSAYRRVLCEFSLDDQRRIFHDNAVRFYGLGA